MSNQTDFVTPAGVANFCKIESPEDDKFSMALIIPSDALTSSEFAALKSAVTDMMKANKATESPFKSAANQEDSEGKRYRGFEDDKAIFFNCKTGFEPKIVGPDKAPLSASEIYNGCNVRVVVSPYCWTYKGKKGVGLGLRAIQKLNNLGENLGGSGVDTDELFDAVDPVDVSILS